MKQILMILMFAAVSAVSVHAYPHPGGHHTRAQLAETRTKVRAGVEPWKTAHQKLVALADARLSRVIDPPDVLDIPGYYSDPDGHKEASELVDQDALTAYSCALVYAIGAVSDPGRYAAKARQVLNAWAAANRGVSGYDGPLVMTYVGGSFIHAAELLTDYSSWPSSERSTYRTWVSDVYRRVAESISGRTNNWGDWSLAGYVAASYYLDDAASLQSKVPVLKSHIHDHIRSDGSMPLETSRDKNGIWYTYFALAPMTVSCQIIRNATGEDMFNYVAPNGSSVKEALDYLFYYAKHPDEWPHYDGAVSMPHPDDWPGNLFEALWPVYNESGWKSWVAGARPCMEVGHHYAWTFPSLMRPAATVSVTDREAPLVMAVHVLPDLDGLSVRFSEAVSPATAQSVANYAVSGGVSVTAAALGIDGVTVTLTTSPMQEDAVYGLTVGGISDLADPANVMAADTVISFESAVYILSGLAWQNFALPAHGITFSVGFSVTPLDAVCDAVVCLAPGRISSYFNAAIIVRFFTDGFIDVRNGDAYIADRDVAYTANTRYSFTVTVDLDTRTYDVTVTPAGGSPVALAAGYAFRTELAQVERLEYWNTVSKVGEAEIRDFTMVNSGPVSGIGTGTVGADQAATAVPGLYTLDGRRISAAEMRTGGVYLRLVRTGGGYRPVPVLRFLE